MTKKRKLLFFALALAALAVVLPVGRLHTAYPTVEKSGFDMGTVVTARLYGGTADDAAAVTAAVTVSAFERGAELCMLYTDEANPTSNRVYSRLGYRPVSTSVMVSFVPGA